MRNLKRALSLALASVMILGLMIVGTSALTTASEQYNDYGDVDYKEALDVLTAADILDGFNDNQFAPYESLTREQAAKVLAVMHLGRDKADSLAKTATGFSDVLAGRWSAGYIGFCSNLGLIAGNGDGTFNPEGKLTGAQFGKMLLVALGYDPEIEGFVNRVDWELNVSTFMTKAGIDIDDVRVSEPITREQAAQMILNTIKAPMVEYANRTQVSVGDTDITLGGSQASFVTTTLARATNISTRELTNTGKDGTDRGWTIEFGEQFITDLKQNEWGTDEFGRPSRIWSWKGEQIGSYLKNEQLVGSYTTEVPANTIYTVLGQDIVDRLNGAYTESVNGTTVNIPATLVVREDGKLLFDSIFGGSKNSDVKTVIKKSNSNAFETSGNGTLTEIYVDTDYQWDNLTRVYITSINTYLAKGKTTYKAADEKAEVTVYLTDSTGVKRDVDLDNVENAADIVKDEFYLVNISRKDVDDGEIVAVSTPEILENKVVTKFSKYDQTVNSVTTDGTPYAGSKKAYYDMGQLNEYYQSLLTDKTYNVFVDQYGYAIGVNLYSGSDQYVFITGYDAPKSNLSISTIKANAIFLDGTMKVIDVNRTDSVKNINKLFTSSDNKWDFTKNYYSYYDNESGNYLKDKDGSEDNANYKGQLMGRPVDAALVGSSSTEDFNGGDPRLNTWFKYSVDDDGVYTLTPAKMNSHTYKDTDSPAPSINTKNVSIVGDVNANSDGKEQTFDESSYKFNRSYGNKDSVYISVGLDVVDTNTKVAQITSKNDVLTGVQDVNISIDVKNTKFDGKYIPQVYTVYNNDNYIVGAIVIGSVSGSVQTLAYVLSPVKSESKIDGTYYWEFDAIVNGSIQTLRIKGNDKDNIKQGAMLKVNFDADGNVVAANLVDTDKVYTYNNAKVLTADQIKDKDIYVINKTDYEADSDYLTISLKGGTLYITSEEEDAGLAIANDAKAYIWDGAGYKNLKTFDTAAEAVEELVDQNPDAGGKQFDGKIVAALNSDGSAAWIIFDKETQEVTY